MDFQTLYQTNHAADFLKLGLSPQAQERLVQYTNRLWAENQNINLFSRKMEPETLIRDHVFDCLVALPHWPQSKVTVDLGSGGGLPAAILAICFPQTHFVLFEKSPLKRRFLESLKDLIPNIEVHGLLDEASFWPKDADLVTGRGFKPLPVILDLTPRYRVAGGRYLLYKGRMARIQEEMAAAKLADADVRIIPLQPIGDADERHLVRIGG